MCVWFGGRGLFAQIIFVSRRVEIHSHSSHSLLLVQSERREKRCSTCVVVRAHTHTQKAIKKRNLSSVLDYDISRTTKENYKTLVIIVWTPVSFCFVVNWIFFMWILFNLLIQLTNSTRTRFVYGDWYEFGLMIWLNALESGLLMLI